MSAETDALKFLRGEVQRADLLRPLMDALEESQDITKLRQQRQVELDAVEQKLSAAKLELDGAERKVADASSRAASAMATSVAEIEERLRDARAALTDANAKGARIIEQAEKDATALHEKTRQELTDVNAELVEARRLVAREDETLTTIVKSITAKRLELDALNRDIASIRQRASAL